MLKHSYKQMLWLVMCLGVLFSVPASAQSSSVNGKYFQLKQTLTCERDRAKYGNFSDYGYWKGGNWCGQRGKKGYWVWVAPTWYVWAGKTPPHASANGKYTNLVQTLYCPRDRKKYGTHSDYGYWKGGNWCGQRGQAGYWVWSHPNWFVWGNVR